ncbi:MAG TPA: alpha/beta hydrolase [Candidatus Cybelea sp.]
MLKAFGIAAAFVGLVVVTLVVTAILRPAYTPAIGGANSIAELDRLTIGGAPQYVLIRGRNAKNPILLFLHGGPGMPTMYLAHAFQRPLEQRFTVVQWDRRGAGKSYSPQVPVDSMRVSREIADTHELALYLIRRFHQSKIYLVGFSYGSYLGILVAQRYPKLFYAYVGIGQMACTTRQTEKYQREWIRRNALAANNVEALDELAGRKPIDVERWLFQFGGEDRQMKNFLPLLWIGLHAPEYAFSDAMNVPRGVRFTHAHLEYDVIGSKSIAQAVPEAELPIYFFTGRYDETDPHECTKAYFDRIRAPIKRLVWFDTAHFVFLEKPVEFAAAMSQVAR